MQSNESAWLALAQRGDPQAFSQLVEMYQRPVYNLCYRMLSDSGDAEDAAQETFLRAYKAIRKYDNSRPFPTWLLSIAAHYCIDQIRKRRMTIVSVEELPYLEITDGQPGPEFALDRSEEQIRVRELMDTLNPLDRAAVIMYYWYEFSYEEIAQALDLSLSAVKSRLHRARRSMAGAWIEKQNQDKVSERKRHGEAHSPAY